MCSASDDQVMCSSSLSFRLPLPHEPLARMWPAKYARTTIKAHTGVETGRFNHHCSF